MRLMLVLSAVLSVALGGCETSRPIQRTAKDDPSATCFSTIQHNPNVALLSPRIGSFTDPNEATLEQRASTATPSADEKKQIQAWASIRNECVKAGREFRAQYAPPGYAEMVEDQNSGFVGLLARLYAGQINYGQFVTGRIALAEQTRARSNALREQTARLDAQAREQRVARSNAELSNALMLLQLSQPQPAPLQPWVNCTSRNLNGVVHTNCR